MPSLVKNVSVILSVNKQTQSDMTCLIQGVPGGMDKTSGECSLC